ncbi:nitrous oxide reductase accessory protein NosL [Sulfurimonas sp.]
MMKVLVGLLLFCSLLLSYEIKYNKDDVGYIRHLKLYEYPSWISEIELANGKKILFSSPKGMFEFYLHPASWFGQYHITKEQDFKKLYVTDFQTAKTINAKGAFFVYGSNEISPAGDDLVPFNSYKAAEDFSKKHHGARILSFKEITYGLIKFLNGAI